MYYRQQGQPQVTGQGFFIPGVPGYPSVPLPGGGNVDRRFERIERQIQSLERQLDRLERRINRIENRLGIYYDNY
ncbi:hypothetical protein PZE06_10740 [Robertmurraya sp. DFI.2.37]|jgi:hypothetical protein|uniref:hypothetical protein n=1 Tax=Robertmurraya sp. DFI.2.37 TaxID=3031819 RepID=UPI00124639C5|nr:hypothetical protein [Robertmurraya sp. DFI.2.37]MDF1508667.1 hypothetical protein [Robertmurraya sp. DFI.2.37]